MFVEVDGCPDCDGLDATKCACDNCGECTKIEYECPHCGRRGHMCYDKHGCLDEHEAELATEIRTYSFDDSEESQYGVGGERDR